MVFTILKQYSTLNKAAATATAVLLVLSVLTPLGAGAEVISGDAEAEATVRTEVGGGDANVKTQVRAEADSGGQRDVATATESVSVGQTATSTSEELRESIEEARERIIERRTELLNRIRRQQQEAEQGDQDETTQQGQSVRMEAQRLNTLSEEMRERIRQAVEQHFEAVRERARAREGVSEQVQTRLDESARQRVEARSERLIRRFSAAILRLENISSRLEGRMDILESRGVDVDSARAALDEANRLIIEASLFSDKVLELLRGLPNSEDPYEMLADLRALFEEAKDELRAARSALVEALAETKSAAGAPTSDGN